MWIPLQHSSHLPRVPLSSVITQHFTLQRVLSGTSDAPGALWGRHRELPPLAVLMVPHGRLSSLLCWTRAPAHLIAACPFHSCQRSPKGETSLAALPRGTFCLQVRVRICV